MLLHRELQLPFNLLWLTRNSSKSRYGQRLIFGSRAWRPIRGIELETTS